MSARISSLPVVVSGNIADTDILPIVTGIASNTGVTKRVSITELRLKLGTTAPAGGRTVTSAATYLSNNAVFNVKDFGAFGDGVTDDAAAIRLALTTLYSTSARGGQLLFPHGRYIIKSTIDMPAEVGDGRTIEFRGQGDAILHNQAPAGNPTFRCITGTSSANAQRGFKYKHLIFTGESGFPNHGVHWRFVLESAIEDCLFNCWGSGFYCDGGVFGLTLKKLQFWPTGRKHGAPTTNTSNSAILFDTPVGSGAWANSITIDDIICEAGGRALELKAGYTTPMGWKIGRILAEGLTGANGWGIDLTGLRASTIEALYTELNISGGGVLGDVNDLHMNLNGCTLLTVMGTTGTGKTVVRNCDQIMFISNAMNKFDADSTNKNLAINGMNVAVAGGAGAGYTNASVNTWEFGIFGAGGVAPVGIGPNSWVAPTLLNSWVDYGSGYQASGYTKDATGRVRLRGMIKNGTAAAGTVLFSLPVGFRAAAQQIFPVESNGVFGYIEVKSNGDVVTGVVNNAHLALNGVEFDTNA